MALQVAPQQMATVKEALDTVAQLEDLLKIERANNKSLAEENRVLDVQRKGAEKEIEKLSVLLEEIQRETGWSKGRGEVVASKDFKAEQNRISELEALVQKLAAEQRVDRNIQRKKTQLIETLSKELDSKKQLEEDFFREQNARKFHEEKARELAEELKLQKRGLAKKDKVISTMEGERDDSAIRALETDRRFLQSEIAKHLDVRRQQDRCIKAQQHRISQLETRLETLATALKDLRMGEMPSPPPHSRPEENNTGAENAEEREAETLQKAQDALPSKEAVDLELYELLQHDLEVTKNARDVKDLLLQEKDDCIEALEKKVEVLTHAQRSESRALTAERREWVAQVDDLKRALDIQKEAFREQLEKLKLENSRLKKRIRDLTQH